MIFLQVFTDVVDALLGADPFTEILLVVFTDVCAITRLELIIIERLTKVFGQKKIHEKIRKKMNFNTC